jgi:hypothetical protein
MSNCRGGTNVKRFGVGVFAMGAAFALSCSRRELTSANTQLAGWVYVSGPVTGAVVRAYRLDEGCERGAEVAHSEPTGADGAFTLPLGSEEGRFWLEATGPGTYRELGTADEISLDASVAARAVVLNVGANENRPAVMLSSLTTMATGLGCARHALGKDGGIDGALGRASALIGAHFLGVDIDRTKPADLASATSLTPDARYAPRPRWVVAARPRHGQRQSPCAVQERREHLVAHAAAH